MGASAEGDERSDFAKVGTVTIGAIAGEEAVKLYPTAVGWSIYFSLGVSIHDTGNAMDVS
jgi:hypothetical protein